MFHDIRMILSKVSYLFHHVTYPPVISHIAMENGPVEIVDPPMKHDEHIYVKIHSYPIKHGWLENGPYLSVILLARNLHSQRWDFPAIFDTRGYHRVKMPFHGI